MNFNAKYYEYVRCQTNIIVIDDLNTHEQPTVGSFQKEVIEIANLTT